MIPAAFDYVAAGSVEEAISQLQERGEDAKLLAGGHSLLPLMKLRLATPGVLIDLGRISQLSYIRDEGDHLAIGPLTTHATLERSSLVQERLPLLARAAGQVGDMQVRNRGTIGGSLAHADPAADLPAVLTALQGELVVQGPQGERRVGIDDFFVDIWTSVLEPEDVIREIRVPVPSSGRSYGYEKFRQRASDWAIVGVSAQLTRQNGQIGGARVVLTNVGTTPIRAKGVEEALVGQEASREVVAAAAERAAEGLEPAPELKASPDYKRHLARVLTRRALESALGLDQ